MLNIAVLHGATEERPDEVDTLRTAEAVRDALDRMGLATEIVHLAPDMAALDALGAQPRRPDLVFNLVEAIGGDGAGAVEVPEALERYGVPYTGCGARASRACLSKVASKRSLAAAGLPTPAWSEDGQGLAGVVERIIVKADTEHASLGIDASSVMPASRSAAEMARRAEALGTGFFAEEYIEGREFNVSVLAGPGGPQVLPLAEILFVDYPEGRPKIVDYEAKWAEDSFAYNNTPRRFDFAEQDAALIEELTTLTLRAWNLFGLAGYARIDFRVDDDGRPWILEVNTNPCIAPDAGFFAAAQRAGLSFDAMVARIVDAALASCTEAA